MLIRKDGTPTVRRNENSAVETNFPVKMRPPPPESVPVDNERYQMDLQEMTRENHDPYTPSSSLIQALQFDRTVYWKKPSSLVKLAIALISSIFSSLKCITKYYCNDNKLKTFKDIILNTIIENSNIGFHISDLSARLKSSLQLSSSFVSK